MYSITVLFIAAIIGVSWYAWSDPRNRQRLIMNPYLIHTNKEYYRFITSGFIHSDYMHLGFNMYAFYLFGAYAEQIFQMEFGTMGLGIYALLFVLGIVVSDLPTYVKYKNAPHYNSLGASGGVSAVVFSCILFSPLMPLRIMFIPIDIPGFIFGTLYLMYSYHQSKNSRDNINHDAHLYGALFGIAFTLLTVPSSLSGFISQLSRWF